MSLSLLEPINELARSMLSWSPAAIALFWFTLLLSIWLIYRFVQNVIRVVAAFFYTAVHRLRTLLASIKTTIVCRFRRLVPHRRTPELAQGPVLEFDETDLAVLRLAAAKGPGKAVSAQEIAERLSMRRAKVQRHLDQLGYNKILESVSESTKGIENFRLTAYGVAFLANLSRQSENDAAVSLRS